MKIFKTLPILIIAFIFVGCGTKITQITKGDYYPRFYQNHPKSILVLPAVNTTTSVDATDHFRYTITKPLSERGFYVFPVHLVDNFFKSENLADAEIIREISIDKINAVFNADAILYVDINAWDTGYKVTSSNVDVGLSFSLIDTKTGEELWNTNAYAYSFDGLDTNNGLAGLLVSAIAVAINTATDYTKLARVANEAGTDELPYGRYHSKYKTDNNDIIVINDTAKLRGDKLFVNKYFVIGEDKDEAKIPLIVRAHQKGYYGFSVKDIGADVFKHSGYTNYYYIISIKGKKYLRNRFFKYEDNRPFLLADSKKVFVKTNDDGTIPYNKELWKYYFSVDKIVELEPVQK